MKFLERFRHAMPDLASQRPKARAGVLTPRTRRIEVDEDLFLTDAAPRGGECRDPADANAQPHSIDRNGGQWPILGPVLAPPSPSTASALERKIVEQTQQLASRSSEVIEWRDLHNRQAAELDAAYNEIDRLDAANTALQDAAKGHAVDVADRQLSLISLERENVTLRAKLDMTLGDMAEATTRLLSAENGYKDREAVISTAFEDLDLLNAKLQAQSDEIERQAAAHQNAERRHRQELARLQATADDQARKLGALYLDQNAQLKAREKLAKRCEELSNTASELEEVQRKLAAHAEHTAFLETVMRTERGTAESRIDYLTEELARACMERAAADQSSQAMRVQIAALLLQLMERRRLSLVATEVAPPPAQAAA